MMSAEIVLGRISRVWAAGLLAAGYFYLAANIGVCFLADPISIHGSKYMFGTILGGPLVAIVSSLVVAVAWRRLAWMGVFGFAIWIACVGFANLYVIAKVAASVQRSRPELRIERR